MAADTSKKKTAAGTGKATTKTSAGTKKSASSNKNTAAGANKTAASRKKTTSAGSRKGNTKTAASVSGSVLTGQEGEKSSPLITREAVMLLIFALCIFLFISFLGAGGYIGSVLSDICFGIFGFFAWIFPLFLFLSFAFWISNRGNRLAGMKFGGCVSFYVCICTLAALFEGEYDGVYRIGRLYARCASMKQGGGVIGGSLCYFLAPALGAVGAGVLLAVLALISLVLVTQKSLIGGMKKQGDRVYRSAKKTSERRREKKNRQDAWEQLSDDRNTAFLSETEPPFRKETVKQQESDTREATGIGRLSVFSGRAAKKHRKNSESVFVNAAGTSETGSEDGGTVLESTEPFLDIEYTSKSRRNRKTEPASPEKENRQLDVSVMFAPQTAERRHHRRADGVTYNTRIMGEPDSVGPDVHEILPKAYDPAADAGSYYIDLETETTSEKEQTDNGNPAEELQQDVFPLQLHIEGIEEEEPEKGEAGDSEPPECPEQEGDQKNDIPSEPEEPAQTKNASDTGSRMRRNPRSSEREIAEGIASVEAEAASIEAANPPRPEYVFPPLDLLKKGGGKSKKGMDQEIRQTAAKLEQTLNSFGVHVTVTNVSCGPSVTRYELLPEQGVKVSRIVSLSDDIKLNLAAADIRIEAPIPGKSAVGIEVPNAENSVVPLRDLLETDEFRNHKSKLAFATGKDLAGKVVVSDIAKMPHLLIAGATGSGKSVCINTLIMSILYKAKPEEVKLIMIDPKVVELSVYNGIPHLFIPVVTDPKKAAGALNWGVAEMTDRYAKFAEVGVRDLKGYNQKIEALKDIDDPNKPQKLPQIVIIVDELADLMMVAPGEVEDSICRLAQLARAAGIHLVIATQRPSVNVITGLIKANMPSRIAFSVSSGVDSRTIIDMYGAEKLLGKGDMLFYPQGYQKPARVQGAFVSDEEVSDVVDFLKNSNSGAAYNADMEQQIAKIQQASASAKAAEDTDELFTDAGKFIIEKDKASIGMLQRVFKIGFNRAARIMDQLSDAGVVGPEEGTKPRKILMSMEQFENYLEEN